MKRAFLVPAGVASALCLAAASPAAAVPLLGITGPNTLVGFDSSAPSSIVSTLAVTGLGTERLMAIDFRPANGMLFGIGSAGSLFTINTTTGSATSIGPGVPITTGTANVAFSFNPVPDRIRIGTSGDENLRTNPNDGTTIVDGPLAYRAGDVNEGTDPSIAAYAYTNQLPGSVTTTTLYGIDSGTGTLVLQAPPNDGTLTTIGALGIADIVAGGGIGFDIDGTDNTAFASFITTGGAELFTINLSSGAATSLGSIGLAELRDITVGSIGPVAVPVPAGLSLLGLGLAGLVAARRRR